MWTKTPGTVDGGSGSEKVRCSGEVVIGTGEDETVKAGRGEVG